MRSSASDSEPTPAELGRAFGVAIASGAVAVALAAVVVLVVRALLSFGVRVELLDPPAEALWNQRALWVLGLAVVAVVIRFGIAAARPSPGPGRLVGAVAAGIGVGLVLGSSPLWPAAAVGVGWGIGLTDDVPRAGVAAGVGIVVALIGFGLGPSEGLGDVVLGAIGVVVTAVLLVAVAGVTRATAAEG